MKRATLLLQKSRSFMFKYLLTVLTDANLDEAIPIEDGALNNGIFFISQR